MPIPQIQPVGSRVPEVQRIPPSIISTIEVPITDSLPPPVSRGISPPVFTIPDYSIEYPVIDVPTQEEYDAAVQAQKNKERREQEEKTRSIPDSQAPIETVTSQIPKINVGGIEVDLPEPSMVATAATLAVASTVATMGASIGFNAIKKSIAPAVQDAAKRKFKVKIKRTKPVLHFISAKDGHIDIFEYSDKGTRLVDQVDDVERYLRDKIETDPLYEVDNKVIIEDSMADKFSREGKERFKTLFSPPKKIAKRLGARLSLF